MKNVALVFLMALASCATQPSNQAGDAAYEPIRLQLMSDLDDPKYTSIQVSGAEADAAVCSSERTLTCLEITHDQCHKIYRKEMAKCTDKKRSEDGEDFDASSPFVKGYLRGCAAGGAIKYGKKGIAPSIQCIKANK